jgi:hypothetical protein
MSMIIGDKIESDVTFFSEELCSRADDTLRMAFILTLDRKCAHLCVRETYSVLADRIGSIGRDESLTPLLVKGCWEAFGRIKKTPPGKHIVADILAKISIEARASLAAVDFMGLDVTEAAQCLGIEPGPMRKHLAGAREAMLNSSFAD